MSEFGAINYKDVLRGIIYSALGVVIMSLFTIFNGSAWPTHADWLLMAHGAIQGALGYIVAKFFVNAKNSFGKNDETAKPPTV